MLHSHTPQHLLLSDHVQMNAGEKAALIFGDLDVDGDGTVDEDEFIKYDNNTLLWWDLS